MENILDRGIPIQQQPEPKNAGSTPNMVSISKAEWEAMKETIRLLEKGGVKQIPKVTDHLAKITFYEGKIVVNVGKVWIERKFGELNKREEDRAYVAITTEDGKIHKIDYLDFLNEAERMLCPVKKIDKKDVSINHGSFQTENLNPVNPLGENKYKNFNSDEMEDIESKTDDFYTLEISKGERKGEKIILNHLALNI